MSCAAHRVAESREQLLVDDVDVIASLVRRLPGDRDVLVVEVGAGFGTSALAVLETRSEMMRLRTVDISELALVAAGAAVGTLGTMPWQAYIGDSIDYAYQIEEDVDLLLLDGDHSHPYVLEELRAWAPKAAGKIWVHDYTPWYQDYYGVKQSVEQAIAEGIVAGEKTGGLGWVGRSLCR